MDKRQIWYEPHPVSAERKAELRGQGYIILDAVFTPEGHEQANTLRADGPTVVEYVAAGYQAANYPPSGYASRSTDEEIAEAIAAQVGDAGQGQAGQGGDGQGDGAVTEAPVVDDGLGPLDAAQLHALAKERCVKVHHAAGADKVREALRGVADEAK